MQSKYLAKQLYHRRAGQAMHDVTICSSGRNDRNMSRLIGSGSTVMTKHAVYPP